MKEYRLLADIKSSCYNKSMSFLNPSKEILFLDSKSLSFFFSDGQPSKIYIFSSGLLENQEIKDNSKLKEEINSFLKANKIPKSHSTMFLSDDLIFKKEVFDLQKEKLTEESNKFLEEISLDNQKISFLVSKEKNKTSFLATNKELYELIMKILGDYGIKIKKISPISEFGLTTLREEDIKDVLKSKSLLKSFNFLFGNSLSNLNKIKTSRSSKLLLLIVIALLSGLAVFTAFYFLNREKAEITNVETTVVPTLTPTPERKPDTISVEPKEKEIKKESLKLQVLNGSGGNGIASKMAGILKEKGYKNIETGNSDTFDFEKTEIKTKENGKDIFNLLIEDIKNDYSAISASSFLPKDSPFDAVITVGKE